MAKKTSKVVEKLRTDVQALSEAIWALKEQMRVEQAAEAAANGARHARHPHITIDRVDGDAQGTVSVSGAYAIRNRAGNPATVQWRHEHNAIDSLNQIVPEQAASALSAVGHRQRLGILLFLLQQPASVGELVEALELGTTGAAYHHLNVLQGAGFVVQEERGIYGINPDTVGTLVTILAALGIESIAPVAEKDAS